MYAAFLGDCPVSVWFLEFHTGWCFIKHQNSIWLRRYLPYFSHFVTNSRQLGVLLTLGSCKNVPVYDCSKDNYDGSCRISELFRALYSAALKDKIARATWNDNCERLSHCALPILIVTLLHWLLCLPVSTFINAKRSIKYYTV